MSKGSIIRRKRADGTVAYRLKYEAPRTANGERRTETKTMPHGATLKEAQQELRRILGRVDVGTHVAPSKLTVGAFLDQWTEGRKARGTIKESTAERETYVLKRAKARFGAVKLQQLGPLDVQQLLDDARNPMEGFRPFSKGSVRLLHTILNTAMRSAVRDGLIARNPCAERELATVEKTTIPRMSADDVRRLLVSLEGTSIYPIVRVAIGTGMRRGELLALTWGDVDTVKRVVHVRRHVVWTKASRGVIHQGGKTESSLRSIPITEALAAYLSQYRVECAQSALKSGARSEFNDSALVFPASPASPQVVRDAVNVSKAFRYLTKHRGFDLTLHDCRHLYASLMLAAGAPITALSQRLGHKNPSITLKIYSHPTADADAAANEAAARIGL